MGLVHCDDPEGWYGEGGKRGVQDWEHMYTRGRFLLTNISCINVFIGQSIDIKAKLNKRDLIKLTSFCTAMETINKPKDSLWT